MKKEFNILVETDKETGMLVAEVVELPGCYTQAKTEKELIERIVEAIKLHISVEKPVSSVREVKKVPVEIPA